MPEHDPRLNASTRFTWRRADLAVLTIFVAAACAAAAAWLARTHAVESPPGIAAGPQEDLAVERIDPNTASAASLRRLPGLGPVRVAELIAYRRAHPPRPFARPEDLEQVHGIGPGTVARVRKYLVFPDSPPASRPAGVNSAGPRRRDGA